MSISNEMFALSWLPIKFFIIYSTTTLEYAYEISYYHTWWCISFVDWIVGENEVEFDVNKSSSHYEYNLK
jgi:hypothetical protein